MVERIVEREKGWKKVGLRERKQKWRQPQEAGE